ncbi:MAG: hypothetical protein OHK0012_04090 [Synechococcales cyanobacterium]
MDSIYYIYDCQGLLKILTEATLVLPLGIPETQSGQILAVGLNPVGSNPFSSGYTSVIHHLNTPLLPQFLGDFSWQ